MTVKVRRRDYRWRFLGLGIFVAVFLFSFLMTKTRVLETKVDAASLANFDPGFIISDYQMGNYNSMNEAEIQAFLTSKNPCSNRNYNYYLALSANPKYKWHFENGHFVCLSEERFGDGEVIGQGETAAHIIWQAAQDYKINPQALIVLLQKETSLITDPIPNDGDYRKATGYGCPDTAPCSEKYYGFKNQVRKAAELFSTVLNGGWTNYPLGYNYVQYNPNPGCGGTVVNIRSLATSALYRYTPYQPNPGAIAAGYGEAHCGAYGNRNFYLYFEDWFGGVTADGPDVLSERRINEVYKKYNGKDGILGAQKTALMFNPGSGIKWIEYQNGFIVGSERTGYHVSMGPIREVWVNQQWEFGPLGFPITDILTNPSSGIEWQEFEHGFVVGSKRTGYYISMGETREVWVNQQWEFGPLGFPKSNINTESNGVEIQDYENGLVIAGSQKYGYYYIPRGIYNTWKGLGFDNSGLGKPKTNLVANPSSGILWQEFENGYIVGNDTHGYYVSMGPIREAWVNQQWEFGPLGFPKSNIMVDGNGNKYQKYEGGTIYQSNNKTWIQ